MSTTEERFWSHVDQRGPDECWLWTGAMQRSGYGRFSRGRRGEGMEGAHRYSLSLVEELIDGLHVDHLCRTHACVNPRHLEQVTQAENNRRQAEARTHCIHGHAWTPENTYLTPRGWRDCRACRKAAR